MLDNNSAQPFDLRFLGTIPTGNLQNAIVSGLCIRTSQVAQAGQLDTVLRFPVVNGDKVHRLTSPSGSYTIHTFSNGAWVTPPGAPQVGIGEAFWSEKAAPATWTQNFYINP